MMNGWVILIQWCVWFVITFFWSVTIDTSKKEVLNRFAFTGIMNCILSVCLLIKG
jgi:hypothetical protein